MSSGELVVVESSVVSTPIDDGTRPTADRHTFLSNPDGTSAIPSIDGLGDPVIAIDTSGIIFYGNQTATDVLGWTAEDLMGSQVLDLIHPDDINIITSSMQTVTTKQYGDLLPVRIRNSRGAWVHLELRGSVQIHEGEEVIVVVARDATDRNVLDFDQGDVGVLRSVMANMQSMVALIDVDGHIRSINGAITRILGHDPELIRGQPFLDFIHVDDRPQVLDAVETIPSNTTINLDARFMASDGTHYVCDITVNNMLDDPVVHSHVVSAQISPSLVIARKRVDFLAEHDNRTGLLNRDGFMKEAGQLVDAGGGLGIMIVDIVHFRSINELYGEPAGNAVLTAVAERLDAIRWPDLVTARFAGDEFVLAVRSSSSSAIEMLRERVRRDVPQSIMVDDQEVNFAIRTATTFDAQPKALDSLFVSVSNELMSIKRHAAPDAGSISHDAINERRLQLDQLRSGLTNGDIQPFFQPIVGVDGTVRAVEALVRWVHPVRGVLGVGEVLPLAQMAGLAEAVDDQVLEMALRFAKRLADANQNVEVHVNVDPKVVASPAFGHTFLDRCAQFGADPARMVVEITETDLLAPGAVSLANMQQLRHAGTHVSIDDFGTGYSSLAHLLELPVDGVKIDRRFVAGIDVDLAATNLTTAILGLSLSLGLTCVAEGVEQPYQRDRLGERGCVAFQGWLYAPALPADEVLEMLPKLEPTIPDDAPRPAPLTS